MGSCFPGLFGVEKTEKELAFIEQLLCAKHCVYLIKSSEYPYEMLKFPHLMGLKNLLLWKFSKMFSEPPSSIALLQN